jgi:hypothetical protein
VARQREVLVSLPYDGGAAGVFRDGEEIWLTAALEHRGGTEVGQHVGDRFAREGIVPLGFVVGGVLPEGATRAVVVSPRGEAIQATCGERAWIAVVQDAEIFLDPPVRFETASGDIVRPPLPADWRREPVPDARESCPACGAAGWERVTPTDDSRGSRRSDDRDWEPSPVIVCMRCGDEEPEGAWVAVESERDDEDEPGEAATAEAERWLREHRREQLENLRGLQLPVYALDDWPDPPLHAGSGSGDQGIHSVTVRHGAENGPTIEIETEHRRHAVHSDIEVARQALVGALQEGSEWPQASQPALALWLRARDRERHARAGTADHLNVELAVEGETASFEGFRAGQAWAAVATVGEVRVTISGRNAPREGMRLRRMSDPASELAG